MKQFDLGIIGAGPGGYVTAIKAAKMGLKVVTFEKEYIGGVCLNVGCIPTKTLMKSAHLMHDMKMASAFGFKSTSVELDWKALMNRKDAVVKKLTTGVKTLMKLAGVTIVNAFAEAIDSTHIEAEGETYQVKNIILALGSSPAYPNVKGLKEAIDAGKILDSTGALSLKEKPNSMTVIGGGVIAVEFATMFSTFGVDVTMIQRSDMILSGMDDDVRKVMGKEVKKSGVNLITGTKLIEFDGTKVRYEHKGEVKEVDSEYVLVSLGRKANVSGSEKLGLKMDRNRVVVDEYGMTSVPGVYAIGDMSSKYQLAHVASAEGLLVLDHIAGKKRTLDYNKIPSGIYGFPEVASIGLTEAQVKESGIEYETATFPVAANGRSMASGEKAGFVKVISDKEFGEVLGVHIVAGIATDLISEALMIMQLEGTVEDIALAVHPHPTNSEMIMEVAHMIEGYPIHVNK